MRQEKPRFNVTAAVSAGCLVVLALACSYNEGLVQRNDAYLARKQWANYDYGVEPTYIIALACIIIFVMAFTARLLLRKSEKQKRSNVGVLVFPALLLLVINALCMLDFLLSSWSIPQRCGEGFGLGNCFLFDGLGMIVYYISVPLFYLIAVILLMLNRKQGIKQRKPQRLKRNDIPGIL